MEPLASETTGPLRALSNDLAGTVERVSRAVVAVHARPRIPSTGVHWRPGVIVTAGHTIRQEEEIRVTRPDGRTVPAALAGRDASTDLAVLRIEDAAFDTADAAEAAELKVGHLVLAIGRVSARGPSASLGVISALGGPWRTWRGGAIDQFVQPDLALYPGFSGGPLVHVPGGVVGINTSGLSRHTGITIPAATVNRVAQALLEKGHVARGYLGLGMHPVRLPDALKKALSLTNSGGLIILSVEPGGPAGTAGVLMGDILIALGGAPVNDIDAVQTALGPESVGQTIRATVIRGGVPVELTITVGERPRTIA